jgi:hypothetical protein
MEEKEKILELIEQRFFFFSDLEPNPRFLILLKQLLEKILFIKV